MDLIACNLCNFTLGQKVVVLKDNHLVENFECENIDKLPKMLYNISIEKNINNIILGGNKEFSSKIGQEIKEIEKSKYNFNKKEIEIRYI